MTTSFIPESAPFNEEQRAWLNGFFSGMMGINPSDSPQAVMEAAGVSVDTLPPAEAEEEDFPWHDASLPIVDRMEMAEGRPVERRLMAAMAQLDCGSCGYLCQSYSEAIASGEETNLTLCSPGGKETSKMIKKVLKETDAGANGSPPNKSAGTNGSNGAAVSGYSRKKPYAAKLIESRELNLDGSAKDTRHVAIDLGDSGVTYDVGDALGVYATNCHELVDQIIRSIGGNGTMMVTAPNGTSKTLAESICEDYCLKDPSDELLELVLGRIDDSQTRATLERMLDEGVPEGFDVLDVLEIAKEVPMSATEFLETLSPLNPRLYSIASSQKHVGNQVHLTVGKVAYEREGRLRKGVASTMLSDRLQAGETLRVFVQPNHGGFTVPASGETPMIMIGPGTGIAPFMAFLQEREATQAKGKNWLFFGDQHESTDFLYEGELRHYCDTGLLTRLDTAFSRDGDQKVYVQDRMRENGAMLWQWLESGAHLYVCGDATRMAADVDRALKQVVHQHGNMDEAAAEQYVKAMTDQQRYVRDVY